MQPSENLEFLAGPSSGLPGHSSSRLLPTIPSSVARYDHKPANKRVSPGNLVPAGLFCYANGPEPPYLPHGWTTHIQPEGQVYFACESTPRIVTDAQMYSESAREHVLRCAATIVKLLESKNMLLPDSAEVYIMPLDYDDACLYYFVDHASRALFWLDDTEVADLGLGDVVSESHLAFVLQEQYWTHIEQFPSHRFESLNLAIDELIAIFIHGEGDQMTSVGSTFAYTAKQAKQYTRILKDAREHLAYAPSVCIVARIWGTVYRFKWNTWSTPLAPDPSSIEQHWLPFDSTTTYSRAEAENYVRILQDVKENLDCAPSVCTVAQLWVLACRSQREMLLAREHARQERAQGTLNVPDISRGCVFDVASSFLHGIPAARAKELEKLCLEIPIYMHAWPDFVRESKNEWKEYLPWIFALAIINLVLFFVSGTSMLLLGLSLLCCAIAAGACLALLMWFHTIHPCDPVDVIPDLDSAKGSWSLTLTALALSLPQGMFYHAVSLMAAQALMRFSHTSHVYGSGALVLLELLVSFAYGTWYESARDRLSAVSRWWHRSGMDAAEADDVIDRVPV